MKNNNNEIIVIGARNLDQNPSGLEVHCKNLYENFGFY